MDLKIDDLVQVCGLSQSATAVGRVSAVDGDVVSVTNISLISARKSGRHYDVKVSKNQILKLDYYSRADIVLIKAYLER